MSSRNGKLQFVDLTGQSFASCTTGDKVAVVDFWAPWCGPCRKFAPVMEKVAVDIEESHPGKVEFFKVNVDDEGALAETYNITMIPTIIAFSGGKIVDRYAGARGAEDFLRWVTGLIQN